MQLHASRNPLNVTFNVLHSNKAQAAAKHFIITVNRTMSRMIYVFFFYEYSQKLGLLNRGKMAKKLRNI